MSKYLKFELIEKKKKTKVYAVLSKFDNSRLAIIKWFTNWRCYSLYPENDTIWEIDCLNAIIKFLEDLKQERKNEKS